MRILDIDLDFFLCDVRHSATPGTRADPELYQPWPENDVRLFLEQYCGITKPIPGRFVVEHVEVFNDWERRINSHELITPFEVIHVDAHADLGLGDSSYLFIATKLLGTAVSDRLRETRQRPNEEGLLSGNYLAFAIACRWLSSLTYVHHWRKKGDDFWHRYVVDMNLETQGIQMPYFGPATAMQLFNRAKEPRHLEPRLPFTRTAAHKYRNSEPYDLMYLAHSPLYTPTTADPLIDVIREYMNED